ncbi:MAG: hypothetical protein PHV74_10115 [Dehalococcoidia bacterium]|nr:hypothetical protein [Dehalococcoidia bacterium]
MWVEVKVAANRNVAEMWKDLFEGRGVPTKIVPAEGSVGDTTAAYRVYVPSDKTHVIEGILGKS